jgi:hypothetical protein
VARQIIGTGFGNIAVVEESPSGMNDRVGNRGKATAFARAIRPDDAENFS